MTVIALGTEWLVTGGDIGGDSPQATGARGVGVVARYPVMHRSSTVVWHPEQCSIGVASFEGDPRHAATLLERRLRSQGEISTEVKILILQSQQVGRAYQVLYVTVALEEWQHMLSWAASQAHLCRLTLAVGVAYKQVQTGHAIVLQVGRHLHFLARHDGQLIHRQAVSVDDAVDDMTSVAAMLGAQAREEMAALGCDQFEVSWIPAAFRGERVDLDTISSAFAGSANVLVRQRGECLGTLMPQAVAVHSGLPGAVQRVAPKDMLNQGGDRLLVLVREYLAYGAMASLAVSMGLAYVAYGWTVDASAINARTQQIGAEIEQVRDSVAVIARDTAVERPALNRQIEVLALLRKIAGDHDPARLVEALKQGAQGSIRILSVTSDRPTATGQAAKATGAPALIVDGSLPEAVIDSNQDTRSLAMFVKTLAEHGYRAEPIDARSTASGQDASTRLFSYRVTPAETLEKPGS